MMNSGLRNSQPKQKQYLVPKPDKTKNICISTHRIGVPASGGERVSIGSLINLE